MAADYRHIGGVENRLGRHYSRFSAFWPARSLPLNDLPGENRGTAGRIGEVGLAANESAPPQPGKAVQGFPPPNGDPPAKTASVSEPASRPAVSSASLTPLASPPPFAPDAVLPGAKGQPALDGRSARPRTTSQHSRPRSARSGPKLIPQQSRFAQTLTPPQTSSFGQLLAQLTGESEPIGQALTPPRVEQPDPFAQRVWNK